jgi:hypothetical protein
LADDQYAAFLCGGTTPLTPALEAELARLSPSSPATDDVTPLPGAGGTVSSGSPSASGLPGPVIAGAGALLTLLLARLLLRRRRRT